MCALLCGLCCAVCSEVHVRMHPLSPLGLGNKSPKAAAAPKKLRLSPALSALASVSGAAVAPRSPQTLASVPSGAKVLTSLPSLTTRGMAHKEAQACGSPPGLVLHGDSGTPAGIRVAATGVAVYSARLDSVAVAQQAQQHEQQCDMKIAATPARAHTVATSMTTASVSQAVTLPVNKFKLLNKTELCKFFATGACKRASGESL